MTLVTHCGGWTATQAEVEAVPVPEQTEKRKQWNPLPYGHFLEMINNGFGEIGVDLDWSKAQFALAGKDGGRFFGVVPADAFQKDADWIPTVGIRQSYDSSFAASICIGNKVFVCDNLCFSGDINIAFKNTTNIRRELPQRLHEGAMKYRRWSEGVKAETDQMKIVHPSQWETSHILIESVRRGIFPPSKLKKVIEEFDKPRHEAFADPSAWSLFNAFTQVNHERSPEQQFKSGTGLIQVFRDHCLKENREMMTAEQRAILMEMEREGQDAKVEFGDLMQQPVARL